MIVLYSKFNITGGGEVVSSMGKQRNRQLQDGRGTSNRNYRQEIGERSQETQKEESKERHGTAIKKGETI